jgi:outer membrane receptor protein involved in Fe transport
MKYIFTLILIYTVQISFCQNATIKGSILDDSNASPLPGVNILIRSIKLSTTSDSEGKFIFRNVKPGTYDVEFTFIGYKSKVVSEVIVITNETTELNSTLEEVKNTLDEVVITKTRAKAETVKSLLTMQKNNVSVSDGISAESIKKTPDRTTSDVLKRISGASIQDNKFVIIRGLNDRYNFALLNGAPLPSSEPDRKAFSFDIFPSNILDNLIITKTASPDLPGEFAGGVVQINTKSVSDKDFQTISIGSGYNTITTFKEQKSYEGSKTDWIGYDNGTRDLPSNIPSVEVFNSLTSNEKVALAKTFEYDWSINDGSFKPNTNFQYTIGRSINFGEKKLGIIASISNNQTNNFNPIERIDYDNGDQTIPSVIVKKFNDNNYTEQVLTAGLANFSFKFNQNHSIKFQNVYSINSTDLVVERYGQDNVEDTRFIKSDVRWFTSNKIYSGQFNGENNFPSTKIKVNWNAFFSDIKRDIPNLRRNIYTIEDPNSSDPGQTIPIAALASNSGGPDQGGGMFFSENKENIKGGKFDISKKFTIAKDLINEFKIGGLVQFRDRDFFARQLQYNTLTINGTFNTDLLELPNESIFSIQNFGILSPGVNGFTLNDYTKFTDAYTASADLKATYLMFDNRYEKIRLVWGFRFEEYTQRLNSRLELENYLVLNQSQKHFLPSVNLIYSVNKKQNLRLSYSKTLNRPEFRELAPFGFYDFTTRFFTQGNPLLKVAEITNLDFRYELYPGKGQIFSVSYFNKKFKNPIEVQQTINNNTVIYDNAKGAVNRGVELEFRTLLSSIFGDKYPVFEDITLYSNVAIIKSEVDITNFNSVDIDQNRPLQGQSPYIFNGGIQYGNETNGWSVSTNINRAGNRIFYTESQFKDAIWEKSRTFLDAQISKSFNKKKIEIKLNIQNILAQDLIFYQNNYKNSVSYGTVETLANQIFTGDYHYEDGFNDKDDDVLWRTKYGRSFSLTFTYNF